MEKSTFKVFNIESPVNQLVKIDQEFEQVRSFENWDDTEAWMSKDVFHHDLEDDPKDNFDYRYMIEAYQCEDDGNTYYHIYMVPCYSSLSEKMKKNVLECSGVEEADVNERDVFDYGCMIVLDSEKQEGEYNPETMDKIASVYKCIDRLRGFYLDRFQNRIGNTGWDMLAYYMNDEDFTDKALERFAKEKEK